MRTVNKVIRAAAAVLIGAFLICSFARAQQNNPNNLPPCPKEQNVRYHNCFGTFKAANGDIGVGEFKDGEFHGQVTYTFANGDKYVGEFKDGKFHGQGTYHYLANNQFKGGMYVGEFKNNKKNGQGTLTFTEGHGYTGEWLDGQPHGKGRETFSDGRLPNEGLFDKGKFVRAEKLNTPNVDTKKIIDLENDFGFSSKYLIPKVKNLELCKEVTSDAISKLLYVWMIIDANIDKNSAEKCLDQETKYLNNLMAYLDKKSSDSELVSDSTKYQRKASQIKGYIKELSAANCVWKALDALNEPIREKAKSDMNKLDEQGLTLLLAFKSDETAIDLDLIYNNFKENRYNLPAVFKRINSYLSDDSIDFKNTYFKRDGAAEAGKRKLNRQVELEKARKTGKRFDESFEQFNNTLMAATSMQFKVFVPHRLEFLATGTCPSDDSPSLMRNYMEYSFK